MPLFLLSVCFALSLHWTVAPELGGAEGRGGRNPCRHLDCVGCRQRSELSLTCYLCRCHCFYFLCSDAALDPSLLLSPTADYSTHLPLICPGWRALWALMNSQRVSGHDLGWSYPHQSFGLLLMLEEVPVMAIAAPSRHCPRTASLLCPVPQFSPQLWQLKIQCCQACASEYVGLECLFGLAWAAYQGGHRKPLCLPCGQTSTCVLLMSRVEASHWPFASPSGPPSSQENLSLLSRTLGLEHPVCGPHHSLARVGLRLCTLPFPFRLLPESQVLARSLFSPFYPITRGSFLQP